MTLYYSQGSLIVRLVHTPNSASWLYLHACANSMYQALHLPLFRSWERGNAIYTKILILFLQVQVHNNFTGKYVGIELT